MKFDPLTLIVVAGLINILQASAIYFHYSNNTEQPGIIYLTTGFTAVAVGFILLLTRQIISFDFVSIILANSLLMLGNALIYIGIVRFLGRKENKWFIYSILSLAVLFFILFTYVYPSINNRNIVNSAFFACLSMLIAFSLLTNKNRLIISSATFLGIVFALHELFFLLRIILLSTITPIFDLFSPSPIQIGTYFVQISVGLLMTFGIIAMVNQKLSNEIKEAKEHFESIFNTSPDAAMITRLKDGLILDVNHRFCQLSGYTKEQAINHTTLEINVWKEKSDREKVVQALKEKGYCENIEGVFIRKDQSEFYGMLSAKLITLNNTPSIICMIRDISEKKQYEAKLLQLRVCLINQLS